MYEQHEPTLIGTPLRDATNPADNVQPAECAVCGIRNGLRRTNVPGPLGVVCVPHLDAALLTLGPATVATADRCSGPHSGNDPMAHGVTAVWPLSTSHDARQATIRACPTHLAAAITTLESA